VTLRKFRVKGLPKDHKQKPQPKAGAVAYVCVEKGQTKTTLSAQK
jgi:hypothetical protein